MKKCTKCQKMKPNTEFWKCKTTPDGLNYWCKQCWKEWKKNDSKTNPGKYIKKTNLWRKENPKEYKDIRGKYYKTEKGHKIQLKSVKKYIAKNREWVRELHKQKYIKRLLENDK